jgi:hypothetical protein
MLKAPMGNPFCPGMVVRLSQYCYEEHLEGLIIPRRVTVAANIECYYPVRIGSLVLNVWEVLPYE